VLNRTALYLHLLERSAPVDKSLASGSGARKHTQINWWKASRRAACWQLGVVDVILSACAACANDWADRPLAF
jgi:hypothetical protein